jgi:putative tryptophan/tyrosine transport system substrate-binding protein
MSDLRRRQFLTLLGGAAVAWPRGASAQQPVIPVIGFLHSGSPEPNVGQEHPDAPHLEESGWSIGRNIQLDMRWTTPDAAKIRQQAAELVALAPDVIFATGGSVMAVLQQATRTSVPTRRLLRRQDFEGREACRLAD